MKRIFGVLDEKGRLRYVGASCRSTETEVLSQLRSQLCQASVEIDRGKTPNSRESVLKALFEAGAASVLWLTPPLKKWSQAKRLFIDKARAAGKLIANEANGGPGSKGVKPSVKSSAKRETSRLRINDEMAYKMHSMWRIDGKTQIDIAKHFGITEKGVQKIVSGTRRKSVAEKWRSENRAYVL